MIFDAGLTNLVLLVRVEKEDIDSLELLNVSVSLELLPHLGADSRDWHVERVHCLDLWSLFLHVSHDFSKFLIPTCEYIRAIMLRPPSISSPVRRTALNHSR